MLSCFFLNLPRTVPGLSVPFYHCPLWCSFRHFRAIKTRQSRVPRALPYLFRGSFLTFPRENKDMPVSNRVHSPPGSHQVLVYSPFCAPARLWPRVAPTSVLSQIPCAFISLQPGKRPAQYMLPSRSGFVAAPSVIMAARDIEIQQEGYGT